MCRQAMWQLPGCPVCLSRADASASGLYTLPFSWLGSAAAVRAASRDAAAFTPTPPEMPEEGTSAAAALRAAAAAALSHCAACAGVLHWMLLKRVSQRQLKQAKQPQQQPSSDALLPPPSAAEMSVAPSNTSFGEPHVSLPDRLSSAAGSSSSLGWTRCESCGRYKGGHAKRHSTSQHHSFCFDLSSGRVWDYAGDCFVHSHLTAPLPLPLPASVLEGPPWIRVVGSGGGAGGPQHGGAPSTTSLTSPHGATLPGGTRRHPQETSSFELRMGLERLRCVATETTPARHGGGPLAAAAAAAECFADSKASAATENASSGKAACAEDASWGGQDISPFDFAPHSLEGCGESLADGCLAGAHAQLPTDAQDGVQEQQLSLILSSQLEYQREIYEVRLHVLASSLLGELELKNAQMSSLEDRALHIQVELADLACRRQDLFASISSLEKENKALSEELLFLTQLTAAMQSDAMKQPNPSPTSTPANATEGISRTDGEVAFAEDAFSGRRHARQHADNSSSSHGYADEQTPPAAATAEDEADGRDCSSHADVTLCLLLQVASLIEEVARLACQLLTRSFTPT
ncbi:zn-finger in ubiquitin-hydrolases domain-containing protein [Cyclospora cayetanensis]|uniref:Zn-finger in ubiquitin-hydrolases domain-containing protein n=1 Tax=Cyclospora cayetanensis TaxID=88456 RepID=A0A1D3D249_9EIME|nr:zn-finger in ubiquitin-hydrolases domain-containing protein [Cyclospora cayetanensis]